MQTIPTEMLVDFKFCMKCGTELTYPYTIEIVVNSEDNQFRYSKCAKCKSAWRVATPDFIRNPKKIQVSPIANHSQFEHKEKMEVGGSCRKCGGEIELEEVRHKGTRHLRKAYYFTHQLRCKVCLTTYFDEQYKVINK